jgi:PTS system mannose-specific IID component
MIPSLSLPQALLIGLVYFAANTSFLAGLGYFTTWRPLVNGLLVGIILGDPARGVLIGALVNVLYLGYLSVGGTLGIGDAALAGILGATIGIAVPLPDPAQRAGLGVLAGVLLGNLGFPLLSWRMKQDNRIVERMAQAASRADAWALVRLNVFAGQGLLFALTVPTAAALAWAVPALLNWVAPIVPPFFWRGVALAGTSLAAVLGLALAMRFVFNGRGVPLFFVGWLVVTAIALLAGAAFNPLWLAALIVAVVLIAQLPALRRASRGWPAPSSTSTFWLWQFFSHSSYSFERLQGSGFASAFAPTVARLYPDATARAAALQRHLTFFNVEPNWGSLLVGITLRLEEQLAKGLIPADAIATTKQSLMGTVSGFGDTVSQGALLPMILCIGLGISLWPGQPEWAGIGVLVYLALIGPLMLLISYASFRLGYAQGREAVIALLGNARLKRGVQAAQWACAFLLGMLVARPGITSLPLLNGLAQQALNAGIALVLVLLFYVLLQRLRLRPTLILLALSIISLVAAYVGIW